LRHLRDAHRPAGNDQRIARAVPRGLARRSHPIPPAERALPLGCRMGLLDGHAKAARSADPPRLERRRAVSAAGHNPAQNEMTREVSQSLNVDKRYLTRTGYLSTTALGLGNRVQSSSWALLGDGLVARASTKRRPLSRWRESSFALRTPKPELKVRKEMTPKSNHWAILSLVAGVRLAPARSPGAAFCDF